MSLEDAERLFIEKAGAAQRRRSPPPPQLGLSRSALYRRLQHYGIRGA
jgi:transcriptional regulator of acetoin/glycerol metabolism